MNQDFIKEALYYEHLTLPLFLLLFGISFILGAFHALSPGHSKSLMAAYLIGSGRRIKDVIVLATTITIAHVFSVVLIGLIALWFMDMFWPETIGRWIGLFSGIAIILIGIWLFLKRFRVFRQKNDMVQQDSTKQTIIDGNVKRSQNVLLHQDKNHNHSHDHHHHYNPDSSFWSNIALGISGGIVPCPKAIVILLLAISLQKIALGISIIIVFSMGIAVVLVTLGITMVKASHLLKNRFDNKRLQILPVIGAAFIIGLGMFITINGIMVIS